MSDNVFKLPGVREMEICAPHPGAKPEHLRAVRLADATLEADGYKKGDHALINLKELPNEGELGAVRINGGIAIGYLFYSPGGDLWITGSGAASSATRLPPDKFKVIGKVYGVCDSCTGRGCTSTPVRTLKRLPSLIPRAAEHALGEGIQRLRWSTDGRGFHVDTEEMKCWVSMFGGDPEDWKGDKWLQFIHEEDREAYAARWQESLDTGRAYLNHGRIYLGGEWYYLVAEANPVYVFGEIAEWRGFMQLEEIENRQTA